MISAGNDGQFRTLCSAKVLDRAEWAEDERFIRNAARVTNRETLIAMMEAVLVERTTAEWCERLTGKG